MKQAVSSGRPGRASDRFPVAAALASGDFEAFVAAFYKVKFNEAGAYQKPGWTAKIHSFLTVWIGKVPFAKKPEPAEDPEAVVEEVKPSVEGDISNDEAAADALAAEVGSPSRRTVLVATMEYEIEDWSVKIKIGGLGVMASLM